MESATSAASYVSTGHDAPGSLSILTCANPIHAIGDTLITIHKLPTKYALLPPPAHNNKLSQLHSGPPLANTPLCRSLPTCIQLTSPAHIIASTGEENNNSIWSRSGWACLHPTLDKNDLFGHYIAIVQFLCLYAGKERQKFVCPFALY